MDRLQERTQMFGRIVVGAAAAALLAGCASPGRVYHPSPGDTTYRDVPVRDVRYGDGRYAGDDRHARQDAYHAGGTTTAAPRGNVLPGQFAGAVVGGLAGAQIGRGNGRLAGAAFGAAAGAYGVGRMADPCQPDLNAGHAIGGVAGGLLGSMVGNGRGRTLATALGAAAGAITGGNVAAEPRCR